MANKQKSAGHQAANESGNTHEKHINMLFNRAEYREIDDLSAKAIRAKFREGSFDENIRLFAGLSHTGPSYITQAPVCNNIFGLPLRADVFAYHPDIFPNGLLVECKYQHTAGSVDEKVPFVVLTLNAIKASKAALVFGGGGCRDAIIRWANENAESHVDVFSNDSDFIYFLRNGRKKKSGLSHAQNPKQGTIL